jgi:hypothetical protein
MRVKVGRMATNVADTFEEMADVLPGQIALLGDLASTVA